MGVNLRGRFTIVKTEPWPSIVRASRFSLHSGDLSLETEQAVLRVKGAPVHEIRWRMNADGALVVWLEAQVDLDISGSYLVDTFDLLSSAYDAVVIGKSDDNTPA